MKKFTFRLQSVLEHRERQVANAQAEVQEAERHLRDAEEAVQRIENEIQLIEQGVRSAQLGSVDTQGLSDALMYLRGLQERVAAAQDGLLRLRNILHDKRVALTETLRHQKVLENLKKRHSERWKEEVRREETTLLDEIATIRYVRTREGSDEP